MAHLQQREFCNFVKQKFPDFFKAKLILDIGALDLNGSNKSLFQDCLYIGVDIAPGPNVDIVSKGHELGLPDDAFETIVSTECFEHDQYYELTIKNIYRMLKPGGLFFFSCATTGRPEHGTRRSTPQDAPLLQSFGDWADYYKNLTELDIRAIFDVKRLFKEYGFLVNEESHDLYFYGIKEGDLKSRSDYSFLARDKVVQLFMDTGTGFSEASSDFQSIVSAFSGPVGPHEFVFDLAGGKEIRALRLDPLNDSAIIEIEKLVLVTRSGEIDLLPNIQTNAIHFDGRRYFFQTADPQVYFDGIAAELLLDAQSLVARILYAHTGQVAKQLAALTETRKELGNSQTALEQTQTELSETRSELESTYATLNQTQSALTESHNELENTKKALTQNQTALTETRNELGTSQTALAQTQTELSETRSKLESAYITMNQTQSALTKSRNELESTQAELDQMQNDMLRLQSALSEQKANLHRMRTSLGWRLTAPLRRLNGFMHTRVLGYSRLAPIPIHHLEALDGKAGHRWKATASDPQFLLQPLNPAVLRRGQWFIIKFDWQCQIPVIQQLFIDCGQGHQDHASLTFRVEQSGEVSIPLYLPQSFKSLRLDPMTAPDEFEIRNIKIWQSRSQPTVSTEHEGVIRYLQAIDGSEFQLYPLNDLQLDINQPRYWQALGSDPHFLLKPNDEKYLTEGWHRAELRIHSEEKQGLAKFYFDTGNGFSEAETLAFLYDSDELVDRIFFVSKRVSAIRFDPLEVRAGFKIEVLRLTPVSERAAVVMMAERLVDKHKGYAKMSLDNVLIAVDKLETNENVTKVQRLMKVYRETFINVVSRNDYAEWVSLYDTIAENDRINMRSHIDAFETKPLISIIMPVFNPKPEWLIEAIESVHKQVYSNWELCIADDASTDKSIRPILERYAKNDSRIKVKFIDQNGHISAASNSALELATGQWVALLDHDDLLSENALFWVAETINKNADVCLIYSDEDKIDEVGRRLNPYFKCDWNVDLFYSQNLITHLGVYRASLLKDIGGFKKGFEGAQDYDIALRCIERIQSEQIHHIPRVLYHWRMHAESTAQSSGSKPYAMLAGERALNEHFQRSGIDAKAELTGYGYRVRYALPAILPKVSLIIPTRNGMELIRTCVDSIIEKTTYPNFEILIIDNGSDEPALRQYFEDLQTDARVRVIRDDSPFNYSALNNAAVKLAQGEILGLLNNDLEVISPDWLSEMVSHALRPQVGAVGARLWYPNNTLQHGGVILGIGGVAGHANKGLAKGHPGYFGRSSLISGFTAVTAACLIVRKDIYEKVGGLNESELQVAFNDVDFCLRLYEAGYRNIWTPYAELYHYESATRGFEDTPEKQARFAKEERYMKQRWGNVLVNDPAYSPNLNFDHQDFSLAWPPRVAGFGK